MAFQNFIKRHLADESNRQKVKLNGFEIIIRIASLNHGGQWSDFKHQPPLGRDLTSGFTNTLDQYATELTLQTPHHKTSHWS